MSDKEDAVDVHRTEPNNGFDSHIKFADQINEDLFAFVGLQN